MFTDTEVFGNDAPSNWVKITSFRTSEPTEPTNSWEQSHGWNHMAQERGAFMMASSIGWSKPTATTPAKSSLTAPTQRAETSGEHYHLTASAPARVCGHHKVSAWGQYILSSHRSSTIASRETGPYPDDRVNHVFSQTAAGYGLY